MSAASTPAGPSSDLPLAPMSAVDVITPAITRAKRLMFAPFQWGRWWRLALIGLATGEMSSGGGSNFQAPPLPNGTHLGAGRNLFEAANPKLPPAALAAIIAVAIAGFLTLAVVHLYIGSVLRFALFDAIATERFRIREAWKRRHPLGLQFFAFNVVLMLVVLACTTVPIAAMVLAYQRKHFFVTSLLVGIPWILLVLLSSAVLYLIAKDFAVPIMALEQASISGALARLREMARATPGAYIGYVVMKALLALVAAVMVGIVDLAITLIIAVPAVLVGIAGGIAARRILESPVMIALLVTLALVLFCALVFVFALVSAPAVAFFESYALEFFALRYDPLRNLLYPPSAPPPPIEPTPEGGEPPLFPLPA